MYEHVKTKRGVSLIDKKFISEDWEGLIFEGMGEKGWRLISVHEGKASVSYYWERDLSKPQDK